MDVKGESFDPNLMPEALERIVRPLIESRLKSMEFPYSTDDVFDNTGRRVAHIVKAKSLTIEFVTKNQVLAKMGK